MRRAFLWLLLIGSAVVVLGVLWQAFSIAAYVRGAGDGALDAHQTGSIFVHLGQLAVIVGAIGGTWRNGTVTMMAISFFVLSFLQLVALGDTDDQGGWVNGLHGLMALVILLAAVAFGLRAWRDLGLRSPAGAAGSA